MSAERDTPREICLIRLSSIGDVCNAVPAVLAIQDRYLDARLTWIIGRAEHGLVADLPGVEFVVVDKGDRLAGLLALRRRMRGRAFDVLLDMQVSLRASLVSLAVRARRRYGFDRARAREGHWLFCNRRIEPQRHAHVVDGFGAFAAAIGAPPPPPRWEIPIAPEDRFWAAERLPDGPPVLSIVPAASAAERNWTAAGYAAVADHAVDRGFRVALLGGPGDQERGLANRVSRLAGVPLIDLVGKTTLKRLLALISRSAALLAPDTGPVHLAVAAGVPVIGLYCHSNPRRTGPYGGMDGVINHYDRLVMEQRGRPWTELPWGTRVRGDGLMRGIRPQEVIATFDRLADRIGRIDPPRGSA